MVFAGVFVWIIFSLWVTNWNIPENYKGWIMIAVGIGMILLPSFIRRLSRYFEMHRDLKAPVREVSLYEAKYERNRMSPRLRYLVMKRDNFKCVLCGRSAKDGVTLHVDHIKPVSKGGKTEIYNLRTLCDKCNLGKGNLYEDGVEN